MALNNQNIRGADEMLQRIAEAQEYLKGDVKEVIGTEAVKHFKSNFFNEGFDSDKWAARRMNVRMPRKILTGQGSGDHLGDSIEYRVAGTDIIIYTDKIYAEIQNDGGEITVTPKMKSFFWAKSIEAKEAGDTDTAEQFKWCALSKVIKITARKFMGPSEVLNNKITDKIKRDLDKILNS